ncbi:remodeling and spacing factor 1 [Aedes albopictus]|uniref:PHD-type domain-containing protein n=1 Tax=Aedes albopictus TaxID=7160 RepID=A0ABM1ZTJ2_AEDAL
MLVKGEGSGAECEAQPIFSDVIEEPILYVYGPGNGIGNQMGNIKKCEESTTEETTPKDLRQTEKSDLPLKKKLNRSYNYDAHQGTSPNESKESIRIVNKVENESTIKKEHHAEYHKSSEHKETDLDMTSNASNDVQENQLLSENEKKTILSEINNTKTEEKNIPYDSAEETSNSSYEELLPKEENSKTCDASSLKTEHDNDKQKPTSRTRHKNTQNTETSTNSEKLKNDKLSPTIESQPSVPQKTRKGRRSKSGIVDGLDISQVILEKENGSPPIRQSRRIAQQKILEETNRRLIEEKMLRQMKAEAMKKKKEIKQKTKSDDDDEDYVVSDEDSRHTESKVKLKKKNDKPWMNSSSESSSESEPEEDYIEPEHSDLQSLKSDHEFSPESDLEDESIVPIKRARTARVEKFSDDENESCDSDVDHSCQKCGKSDHPEWILLCDSCDKGYHCSCLVPVLFIIPEGDWFCPLCQHEKLISNLQSKLVQFDEYYEKLKSEEALKIQIASAEANKPTTNKNDENDSTDKDYTDSEVLKKQTNRRRSKKTHNNSKENSSSSGDGNSSDKHSNNDSDSDDIPIYKLRRRNTSNLSYKLNEYDNLIKSAIDRSTLDSPESPPTHGKDIRNIVKAIRKEEEKLNRSHSNSPVLDEKKKQMKNPLRKKKKLNSLDVSSEEDDGSDEDFAEDITSSDEESFSMTEDSESSLEFTRTKKSRAAANKKKDKDFINDNDDDSDNSGAYNIRKRPNKAKKILDDSDEFNEDDDVTESEEIDSEDLCNDTETDSSDDNWKKRKSNAKVVSRVPVKVNDNTKKKAKKPDDDKTYKSGIRKRPAYFESDSDSSNKLNNPEDSNKRRTRGKKLHYLIDDDFESSDDGITPGVHRPDTPPEEREKFIKKQEEIKRMLAEKNTTAAKQLATPMIQPLHDNDKVRLPTLSTIPPQVIESAKVLDIDFLRSSKHIDSDDFDEELAANLPDPDVNEEELAKIMEEEDFAQHQLKLDDVETDKDAVIENLSKNKIRLFDSIDPAKITKPEKKIGYAGTTERKVDAVCTNLVNYLQSKAVSKINSFGTSEVPANKFSATIPIYHSLHPPSSESSSLLQQMKQQAIPLHDLPIHSPPHILNSKKPFSCTVPSLPPTLLPASNSPLPVPVAPTTESKDAVVDVRRRRRKKITPLRGDLYKAAMDGRILDPTKPLHYPGPPPSTGAMQTYTLPKQPCSTVAPTFVTNSTKPNDSHERFPNPCSYVLSSDYNHGFGNSSNSTSIPAVAQPITSSLNEHPRRSFASLEPVNAEDPVPEQATHAIGSTENNQNEPEGTSEFSGLVSYFSSQQNELNA